MKDLVILMKFIPQNFLSFICGYLARLKLPGKIQKILNSLFALSFGIDMSEAEKPCADFNSIEDLFTRKLEVGARRVQGEVVSPCDGFLAISMAPEDGSVIQAKGIKYHFKNLLLGNKPDFDQEFVPGWVSTIYLAPHNYHRVHSPVSGELRSIRYIPGQLWPVNKAAVLKIPKLFIKNERMVFEIETKSHGKVYVVMVGAFNVGRIETKFWPKFASNSWDRQFKASPIELDMRHPAACNIEKGEELGVFMLGSTVVTVFSESFASAFGFYEAQAGEPIRMGQSLLKD
ncbi:MAG: archaetidylserine decarboxylase [Oligoflexales bacterium]